MKRWLLILAGAATACYEPLFDLPPVERVYESSVVELDAEPGLLLCRESGPEMDRFVHFLSEKLGLGLPGRPLSVTWLTDSGYAEGLPSGCLRGIACTADGDVFTTFVPTEHELVHAYLNERLGGGHRHSFFEEGLAELFGRDLQREEPTTDVWAGLETFTDLEHSMRGRAAHFVGALLAEHGMERLMVFYRDVTGASGVNRVFEVFEETFGETVEAFVERYERETPLCPLSGGSEVSIVCESEPLPWSEMTWSRFTFDMDCDASGVSNWMGEGTTVTFAFDVLPLDGGLTIHKLEPFGEGVVAEVYGCQGCGNAFSFDSRVDARFQVVPPGRYWVRLRRPSGAVGEAGLRFVECYGEQLC